VVSAGAAGADAGDHGNHAGHAHKAIKNKLARHDRGAGAPVCPKLFSPTCLPNDAHMDISLYCASAATLTANDDKGALGSGDFASATLPHLDVSGKCSRPRPPFAAVAEAAALEWCQ
jgi:hypothetical protein